MTVNKMLQLLHRIPKHQRNREISIHTKSRYPAKILRVDLNELDNTTQCGIFYIYFRPRKQYIQNQDELIRQSTDVEST